MEIFLYFLMEPYNLEGILFLSTFSKLNNPCYESTLISSNKVLHCSLQHYLWEQIIRDNLIYIKGPWSNIDFVNINVFLLKNKADIEYIEKYIYIYMCLLKRIKDTRTYQQGSISLVHHWVKNWGMCLSTGI